MCLIETGGALRCVRSVGMPVGGAHHCACRLGAGFRTNCLPAGVPLGCGSKEASNTTTRIRSARLGSNRSGLWRHLMIMIGIDPHKATHTAVAVDDHEAVLAELTVRASVVPG